MRLDLSNGLVQMIAENPADGLSLGCLANMLRLQPDVTSRDVRLVLATVPAANGSLTWRKERPNAPGFWMARYPSGTMDGWDYPRERIPEYADVLWAGPVVVEDEIKITVPKE